MNKITFSHTYPKLIDEEIVKKAHLISVCKVFLPDLPKQFLDYDTTFDWKDGQPIQYPLGANTYIVLTLFANTKFLFTTIRPFSSEKESYYKSLIGKEFDIVIKESIKKGA